MPHPRPWTAVAVSGVAALSLTVASMTAEAAPPRSPAIVGAQTSGDSLFPAQGNGGYDVQHYDLDLAWAPPNTLTATATITARTTAAPLTQFSFDLEGLTVSAVTVDGVPAAFTRVAAAPSHKLVVTPDTPASGTFTTKITYAGTPTTHTDPDGSQEGWVQTADGAVALNEPVGAMTWYPTNNTPADKATFTTRITVPYSPVLPSLNRTAVSNGVLTSTTMSGSTRTFTWDQTRPQAPYLALVGIGRYSVAESDVALPSGTTPEWSFADPTALESDGFSSARGQLRGVLSALESRYGPYPGTATGLVLDVSSLGYALETQDRPYFENAIDDETLIHELAHQWFGNAVSPQDWGDVWLNEGPATFIATQVAAERAGTTATTGTRATYYESWRSSSPTARMWTTPAAGFSDSADLFGTQVYQRGAIALEALRTALGDAVFTRVMRTWIQTYGGRSATTAQFEALAASVSGHDLTHFFQEWIHDADKPAAWPTAYAPASSVPRVRGRARVGSPVTAAPGTWDPATRLSYRWLVDGRAVAGATTRTYTPRPSDVRRRLRVAVTGRSAGQGALTRTSRAVTVAPGVQVRRPRPTIAGRARVGSTLRAMPGAHDPGVRVRFQWYVAGRSVPGATRPSYVVRPSDRGDPVRVTAVASKPGYGPVVRTSRSRRVR